jgi:hypothetical protein
MLAGSFLKELAVEVNSLLAIELEPGGSDLRALAQVENFLAAPT